MREKNYSLRILTLLFLYPKGIKSSFSFSSIAFNPMSKSIFFSSSSLFMFFLYLLIPSLSLDAKFHLVIVICNTGLNPSFISCDPFGLTFNSVIHIFYSPSSEFLSKSVREESWRSVDFLHW